MVGEARRRREMAVPTVYHHTSMLRTNLIWMSGVIALEGSGGRVLHPHLGEIKSDLKMRRPVQDFPALAWFTTRINTPRCLTDSGVYAVDQSTGEKRDVDLGGKAANLLAMNRIAIGFPIADIPVVRWTDHPGFDTGEGRDLNESAIDYGDDPADWYVAEQPVDVMLASEVWTSRRVLNPKLERQEGYLLDVKRMVQMCRDEPGAYIPPSWMKDEHARELAKRLGLPVSN